MLSNEALSEDNIINKIVNIRKKMFHFLDITHPKRHITYENQEEYKNHTLALRVIVWRSMMQRYRKLKGSDYFSIASQN